MIDLVLAVCCSLAIGMILKHAAGQGMDRLVLLTANYAAAFVLAVGLLAVGAQDAVAAWDPSLALWICGVGGGALFIATFFVYALATQVAGMSLAIGVMRVAVVIPFLASWAVWHETPTPAQGLGLVLAGLAFFMIARKPRPATPSGAAGGAGRGRILGLLALLFCAGGLVDVLMKTFDEVFAAQTSRASFLLLIYGVACLIGLVLVLRAGTAPARATLAWGVLLGLINYGSTEFFLRAVSKLSGPFVFPANHIALVVGGALLGVWVWGERLSPLNRLGLALAAGALALLNG